MDVETKKMIEIINDNRNKVYTEKMNNYINKKIRKEKITEILTVLLEFSIFLLFVDVITKIITK